MASCVCACVCALCKDIYRAHQRLYLYISSLLFEALFCSRMDSTAQLQSSLRLSFHSKPDHVAQNKAFRNTSIPPRCWESYALDTSPSWLAKGRVTHRREMRGSTRLGLSTNEHGQTRRSRLGKQAACVCVCSSHNTISLQCQTKTDLLCSSLDGTL